MEANAKASTAPIVQVPGGSGNASLPFELRQAAARYPVTLYTSPGCGPCVFGRSMLSNRGIPFSERTVTSNEDIEALKRLAGTATVPFLTIGSQQLKGFSESEWVQFIDAAGYPKTSQLPTSYRPSPATPLVAAQDPQRPPLPAPEAARPATEPDAGRAATPAPAADNPTGIRF
ncbi:MAG TPA: glutaredoxin domain-containing protein [Ramlibacter sp.]|nr:glutaredoxin domain-containing protein [Ramlibacter sp.]